MFTLQYLVFDILHPIWFLVWPKDGAVWLKTFVRYPINVPLALHFEGEQTLCEDPPQQSRLLGYIVQGLQWYPMVI